MPAVTAYDWDTYYRTSEFRPPSAFARWAEPMFPPRATVVELGCGTGEDAHYFADLGHRVLGIDSSPVALVRATDANIATQLGDVTRLPDAIDIYEVCYIRWLLHAVSVSEQDAILDWVQRNARSVFIEARSSRGEHPNDHYRRPVDLADLMAGLERRGFTVTATSEGNGLSVRGDDDPVLLRVSASLSTKNAGQLVPSDQRKGLRRGS